MKVQIKKALKVFAVCFLSLKQLANGQIMYYFLQLPIMQRQRLGLKPHVRALSAFAFAGTTVRGCCHTNEPNDVTLLQFYSLAYFFLAIMI